MSMTGIGIVLLVSLTTGSFGLAGLLTAATTVAAAVVAPFWGRATDRVGQARVLLLAVLINVLSVALLVMTIELAWPLAVSFAAAIGVGIGFSLAGSAVRARWTLRLNGSHLLHTAFALEAMLDEVVFIIGPVLVTFLATACIRRSESASAPSSGSSVPLPWLLSAAVSRRSGRRSTGIRDRVGCRGVSWCRWPSHQVHSAWCLAAWRSTSSRLRRRRACFRTPGDLGGMVVRIADRRCRYRSDHLARLPRQAVPCERVPPRAVLAAAPVRRRPARRCPAAHPQWNGYCANPDRIDWGNPVGGRPEPTDRGACLELDWYGRGRRRRCGCCRLRDRQFRCTVWLRCCGDCRVAADAQRALGS